MKQKGFTLIELMITVAILGILIAIAYPAYTDYVREGRRAEAMGDLLELSQWMERQFTVDGRYTADSGTTKRTLPFTTSPRSGTAYYNLTISANTTSSFTLQAAPTTNGGQNSDECGTLTITNVGVKTASGSGDCWD